MNFEKDKPFIDRIVKGKYKFFPTGLSLEDLQSTAYLAWVKAEKSFDPLKGSWPHFLRLKITGEIKDFLKFWDLRSCPSLTELQSEFLTVEPVSEVEYNKEEIAKYLEFLPPRQKLVVELYYLEQLSVKEIAQKIGSNKHAINSNLKLARKKLREIFQLL